MRPTFHPRLVNGPFDDPGLFVPFAFENRALLFDLGDISSLSTRDILKLSHIFVTHTHMDHFIGFDRLLRLHLGRGKHLFLYGPEGFMANVEGKLAGYAWNLVANYVEALDLTVTEVRDDRLYSRTYRCSERFRNDGPMVTRTFETVLLREAGLSVAAAVLDHGLPCLGFSLTERFHVNIVRERVLELGLTIGPWLGRFKKALYAGRDAASPFDIPSPTPGTPQMRLPLGELAERIARITPGQKVTYVADANGGGDNRRKIVELARASDHLFIEAAFLERDRKLADAKHHLTAKQAGELARRAGARRLTLFHFSPRYAHMDMLIEEAHGARGVESMQ